MKQVPVLALLVTALSIAPFGQHADAAVIRPLPPGDYDEDGLCDFAERFIYHTDPTTQDTDGDDVSDFAEVIIYHTDPNNQDTDGDGLDDDQEVFIRNTDPNDSDSDDDGYSDYIEWRSGTNPNNPSSHP